MTLEEELKQSKFPTEIDKAVLNIFFTSSWLHTFNAARLKKFDVTPEQFNVLRILRGSQPNALMLADITSRMIDRSSNATRLVEKLRLKSFVKREICEGNRRQVDIHITDKGMNLLTKIDKQVEDWSATIKGFTRAEAKELNRLLDKLRG